MIDVLTLKLNAFTNEHRILLNNQFIDNNSFLDYYQLPILEFNDDFFNYIFKFLNDDFIFELYGNKFEKALFSLLASRCDCCKEFISYDYENNMSVKERLNIYKSCNYDCLTVNLGLRTTIKDICLPEFDCINYEFDSDSFIVVSDDIRFIKQNLINKKQIGFLINGTSQIYKDMMIIGCTLNDLNDYIEAYIASIFIYPAIYKNLIKHTNCVTREIQLMCETYPVLYACDNININKGEVKKIEIQSYSNTIDLSKVIVKIDNSIIEVDCGLFVRGVDKGSATIYLYYESPKYFAKINVEVLQMVYIKTLEFVINVDTDVLCINNMYEFNVNYFPCDAGDVKAIKIFSSDENIASIDEDKLITKKAGEFDVFVNTEKLSIKKHFIVKDKIKHIKIDGIPNNQYIGEEYEVNVLIEPKNVFDEKYRWVSSNNQIVVIGKREDKQYVKIKGLGKAVIKCISVDDNSVFDEITIDAKSTFDKKNNVDMFFSLGIICTFVSLYFMFVNNKMLYGVSALFSCLSIIYTITNKKYIGVALFFLIILLLSFLIFIL